MTKHIVVRVTRKRTVDIVEFVNVDVIVEDEASLKWNAAESRARKLVEAKQEVGETVDWKLESETDRYQAGNAGLTAKIESIDGQNPESEPVTPAPQPQADTAAESA